MIILRQKNYSKLSDFIKKITGFTDASKSENIGEKKYKPKTYQFKKYEPKQYEYKKYVYKEYKPKQFSKSDLNKLGRETEREIKDAVKGTKAEKKVGSILKRSGKEMKKAAQKEYSKQDREVVPADIVKKVKDGGCVIQKDHNGDWRIVSMKTNPPTFWDAHYDSKALASKALGGYFANKH